MKNSNQIKEAIAQLNRSERGKRVLSAFAEIVRRDAFGLDSSNWFALITLATESANGRRDWMDGL